VPVSVRWRSIEALHPSKTSGFVSSPMPSALLILLATLATPAAIAAAAGDEEPSRGDVERAMQTDPRAAFTGRTHQRATTRLNAQLLQQAQGGIGMRSCEAFTQAELDAVLLTLAGRSARALGAIYEGAADNRRQPPADTLEQELERERGALLAVRESNHSLGVHLGELARDRKCTQAVMRYAHHVSASQRRALRNSSLHALPLLPTSVERDYAGWTSQACEHANACFASFSYLASDARLALLCV
jgi:hypothetical protein